MNDLPHRRFTLTAAVSGDSWEAVLYALHELVAAVGKGARDRVELGVHNGWRYLVAEDPMMTQERYFAELAKKHGGQK